MSFPHAAASNVAQSDRKTADLSSSRWDEKQKGVGREREGEEMTGSWRKAERGLELVKVRVKEGGIENKSDMSELHRRRGLSNWRCGVLRNSSVIRRLVPCVCSVRTDLLRSVYKGPALLQCVCVCITCGTCCLSIS